ncbi:MAG: radical SAM protein [Candidatus Lokiarchaeota archaeon]|nr:radical SAM protein [Candidatus Lokiarchaeota archaeon]
MKKIKKIKFILPDQNRFSANFSTFEVGGLRLPHLGLIIIGEMLNRRGYSVKVYEEKIRPIKMRELSDADLIGISIQTITAIRGYQLAEQIRKQLKTPVVIGGTHATLNTEEAAQYADYVVRNEGEWTFLELIESLENNIPPDDVLGVSFMREDEIYHNPTRPFIEDLETLPYPNWELIEGMFSTDETLLNSLVYPLQITRGCPFNCTFCSVTPTFGKKFRTRSIESVMDELRTNKKKSQKFLFFYDDNIVGNKRYLKDLLSAMIENDLVPEAWHSQMRADVAEDDELLELMEETNCTIGTFGFESINPSSLEKMKKGQSIDLIEHCIETMHQYHVFVNGFFVFGFEDDTEETIRDTVKFAREKQIDTIGLMPLTPFPGTPQFDEMKDVIFSNNWELFDVQHVTYYPEQMTPYKLYKEVLDAYPRFYDPKGRKNRRVTKKGKGFFSLDSLFEIVVRQWSERSFLLYQLELMANSRYMKWLKNLPDRSKIDEVKDFNLEKENMGLQRILKKRYKQRMSRMY